MAGEPIFVKRVNFKSGLLTLEGLLSLPPDYAGVSAIVCHPHPLYGGDMNNLLVARIASALAATGVAVLRFNFRGAGASEGFHDGGEGEAGDISAALTFLLEELRPEAVHLAGYSFGAAMMMKMAENDRRAASLSAVAPPVAFMKVGVGPVDDGRPKLVVTGSRDGFCDQPAFARWYEKLAEPKLHFQVEGADHFFGGVETTVAATVADFLTEV